MRWLQGATRRAFWMFLAWRLRTWARFAFSPAARLTWREIFKHSPSLHNARHYRDFAVMAGYYNDMTRRGNMTARLARRIYEGH